MLADMSTDILKQVLFHAGPKCAARVSQADLQFLELCAKDCLWDDLSRVLWPPETLPPLSQITMTYESARDLVKDGNRQGAWISWVPKADLSWQWKYNDRNSYGRFYAGKITQIAIDDIAGHVCFYVHAVSNYPDLRPACTSSLYKVSFNEPNFESRVTDGGIFDNGFKRLPNPQHKTIHQRCGVNSNGHAIAGLIEEKVILKWSLEDFSIGQMYAFFYATSSNLPEHSDYYGTTYFVIDEDLLTSARSQLRFDLSKERGMSFIAPDSNEARELFEERFPFPQLQRAFPELSWQHVVSQHEA